VVKKTKKLTDKEEKLDVLHDSLTSKAKKKNM